MNTILIPGSFDPPTLGHMDVIKRGAKMCKHVIVGVAQNSQKKLTFSCEEREALLKKVLSNEKNVEVCVVGGLIVDFAKKHDILFLIRGLRAFSNIESEFQMALANKKLGNIETLFLMSDGKFAHISSTLIREVAACGHHLKDFVPEVIEHEVFERLRLQHVK